MKYQDMKLIICHVISNLKHSLISFTYFPHENAFELWKGISPLGEQIQSQRQIPYRRQYELFFGNGQKFVLKRALNLRNTFFHMYTLDYLIMNQAKFKKYLLTLDFAVIFQEHPLLAWVRYMLLKAHIVVTKTLHKPYVNRLTLREQNLSFKYCQSLDQRLF